MELGVVASPPGRSRALASEQPDDPTADMNVAQAARAILDVRLEMEKRAAVLRVAGHGDLRKPPQNALALFVEKLRKYLG